jgi:hypothetical protein
MTAVTTQRAARLITGWDTYGEELEFVENASGSTAHVVAGLGRPAWADREPPSPIDADLIVDVALGTVYTVCGVRIRCNRGGMDKGGRLTGWFADEKLCQRCHAAFGDRADLIFECNQPPPRDDDTTA